MCRLVAARGSAPHARRGAACCQRLETRATHALAPLLLPRLSRAAIRFALSDGPAVAANGTRAGLLWVSRAAPPCFRAVARVICSFSAEMANQNGLGTSQGAAARRGGAAG